MGDMDSGNSGSMQSSSTGGGGGGGGGDDQEFQSRGEGEPMSTFFNPTTFDNTVPFQLYSLNNGSSFDHHNNQVPNYFDLPTFAQPSLGNFMINNSNTNHNHNNNNLDMVWPNKFGLIKPSLSISEVVNCTTGLVESIDFNNHHNHNHISTSTSTQQQRPPPPPPPPPTPLPIRLPTSRAVSVSAENSPRSLDQNQTQGRNSKKRSRASRRAPTTVLTTDTSNFRQMVQDFTGIPAPPFAASAAFPSRTRLDLFGGLGIHLPSAGVGPNSSPASFDISNANAGTPYLLKPFPQKVLPHYPHASSTIGEATAAVTTTAGSNQVNMFQSLPVLIQQGSSTSLVSRPTESLMNEFELGHITTTATTTATRPVSGTGNWSAVHRHQTNNNYTNDGGNCNGTSTTTAMANGVASDNHGGGTTNRGEGMVDSWICSSD